MSGRNKVGLWSKSKFKRAGKRMNSGGVRASGDPLCQPNRGKKEKENWRHGLETVGIPVCSLLIGNAAAKMKVKKKKKKRGHKTKDIQKREGLDGARSRLVRGRKRVLQTSNETG